MALQLWETFKESIVACTGLSPATFFTVLALGLAIYYVVSGLFGSLSDHHQRPRDYQERMQALPPPLPLVETSDDELKQYDGTDPEKSLLMANKRQIYDVSQSSKSYDVFLSFIGTDVCNNFVGHLQTALNQREMNTYFNSEELKKGEQISPALMEMIEESRIAIVVFSKNYASSTWCLDELAKIMECKKQRDLIVFPVFYKVKPREVRTPRESYREVMAKHEVKFGKDSERVTRWKKALFEAGNLPGTHFPDGYEAGHIQYIMQEISFQLDPIPLHVAKHPVGIESRVQELKAILNLQSKNDVLMVGLWGIGGVGKTTLAKAIFNDVVREFQGSSFLGCVRENSNNSIGLVSLQEKLLSEVLRGRNFAIHSVDMGSLLIQQKLCNKKALIILDDINDICQLDALARNHEWFGRGSRIIITTRDKLLLTSYGVCDHFYKVKALTNGEAHELFRRHAFSGNQEIKIKSDLVAMVLDYARGLPLALAVLGSFLCNRGEREWEMCLQKLSRTDDQKINDVLRMSYDGLEYNEKEVFLDIACFFKGQSTAYTKKVLGSCNFHANFAVEILIERSLISEENWKLQMHDLIQLMGMDIVKQECPDDPQKRSRLWINDDVLNVLSRDLGTAAIKAIGLELPMLKEIYIGPNAFTNMKELRLLILRNVHNSFQGPIHLPSKLSWFEWPHCASIPEFGHDPMKLVGLDLRNSKTEVRLEQFKDFKKLRFINFSECQSLVCIPDLDCTPYLEVLDLHGCKNLEHAHESIAYHGKLRFLNLSGCSKLHHLPNVLRCKNLELLNLNHCSKLHRFPDIPQKIEGLRGLYLIGTSIKELPASIENLVSLEEMDLRYCKKLTNLPSSIYRLLNLERLTLEGCSKLVEFPKEDLSDSRMEKGFPKLYVLNLRGCKLSKVDFLNNHSCFPSLRALYLLGNKFTSLPTCEQLHNLLRLDISYCQQLQEIPPNPQRLCHLWAIGCESLSKLPPDKHDVEA